MTNSSIKSIPIWQSILFGVIISSLGIISFYILRPFLEKSGFTEYAAYLFSISVVFIIMLVWSILAYFSEDNDRSFKDFVKRVRLDGLPSKWFFWTIGLTVIMFLSLIIFSPILSKLISHNMIPFPENVPDFINPTKQLSIIKVREQLISQGVIAIIPVILILNIFSEEIFWRGIILPRQELTHGKNAFWIHSIIWAFTHLFQFWLLFPIFIGSVALSYIVQKTKSTWISIIAHLLNNSTPFLIMAIL